MDTFAAMALASIPPSPDVNGPRKPRKQSDFITTPAMRNATSASASFHRPPHGAAAWMNALPGGMDTHRLTVFFTVFVMLQFWNLFNAGVFGTDHSVFRDASRAKGLLWTALLILAGQIIIVTFGGEVFRTEPLPLHEWLLITAGTSLVLWAGEAWAGRRTGTAPETDGPVVPLRNRYRRKLFPRSVWQFGKNSLHLQAVS